MLHCKDIFHFLVGMLVILIIPPGIDNGLAVLEEMFGPVPAPRFPRPSVAKPTFTTAPSPSTAEAAYPSTERKDRSFAEPTPANVPQRTATPLPEYGNGNATGPTNSPLPDPGRNGSAWSPLRQLLYAILKDFLRRLRLRLIVLYFFFSDRGEDYCMMRQRQAETKTTIDSLAPDLPKVPTPDDELNPFSSLYFPSMELSYEVCCQYQLKIASLRRARRNYKVKAQQRKDAKESYKAKNKRLKTTVKELEAKVNVNGTMLRELQTAYARQAQWAHALQTGNNNLRALQAQYSRPYHSGAMNAGYGPRAVPPQYYQGYYQGQYQGFHDQQNYQGYGGHM